MIAESDELFLREAEEILSEARALVNHDNWAVVHRAIRIHDHHKARQEWEDQFFRDSSPEFCPHCKYPEYKERFQELDAYYTRAKRILSRLRNYVYFDPASVTHIISKPGQGDKLEYRYEVLCRDLKAEMKEIGPCPDCIIRYNPTGKHKYMGRDLSDVGPYASSMIKGSTISEVKIGTIHRKPQPRFQGYYAPDVRGEEYDDKGY